MRNQYERYLKWVALLVLPTLFGIACFGITLTSNPTTSEIPFLPKAVVLATSTPPILTPEPVITSTAPTAIPASENTGPTTLFQDDFTDITSGWPDEQVHDNYYIGYHEPEFYHVEVHELHDSAIVVVPDHTYNDITVETEVFVDKTNTDPNGDFRYGLALRRSGHRYYAFTISPRTQQWYILKSSPSSLVVLAQGTDDSIQGLAAHDTLRVDAAGSDFVFYLNGQAISQLSDQDYTEGEVGFFVETFDSPRAHIHYELLTIRELENRPPDNPSLGDTLTTYYYQDDFTDITSGWPNEQVYDNYYIGYHEPEFYHVEVHEPHDSAVVMVPNQSYDDVTLETEVFVDETNTDPNGDFRYGLAFRRSGNQYYAFTISPRTQQWAILKSSPNSLMVLAQGTDASIQGLAAHDTLRVDAIGSDFVFHLNDQIISQLNDLDYTEGEVGFFVETFDSPRAHIHYELLTIREAEAPPPPAPLCTVVATGLNLRTGPSVAYRPPITVLPNGTQFEPLARNPEGTWLQVRLKDDDRIGWVAARPIYIACNMTISDLPAN